jgi:transposase InsO family protein
MLPEGKMSNEDKMTIDERRKYLRKMKKRYVQAPTRKGKGQLLDEMEAVTELHRKSLTRLMNGSLERQPRQRQRGRTYGSEVQYALSVIAESLDYLCAERLTPNLVWMANHLAIHGELEVSPPLLEKLDQISISTAQRVLARIPRDKPRLPRKGPQHTRQITQGIPMIRIPWDLQQPGHFEVDLVHHCGPAAFGEYMCTMQMIDVATGWSERRAVLGRSYLVMKDAFRYILTRLPFPILELHPDNGSEFFNHHLLRFFKETVKGIKLSRSRPYHKNDNRFVEQKNSTLVRAYLGDDRLDTVAQTIAVNQLYDKMWVYYNLFQPVMRLTEKIVTPTPKGQLAKVKRRYDQARTPFDRLCQTTAITQQRREQLEILRDQTNPRQLRQEIYDLIDYIFSLPNAIPGQRENVHLTLATRLDLETVPLPFTLPDPDPTPAP